MQADDAARASAYAASPTPGNASREAGYDALFEPGDGVSGAVVSDCGTYRYVLWRQWGPEKPLGFVMLNPSTADAKQDDPTIRRCIGFAKREGYDGIRVVNLFAYRATDPADLLKCPVDVVGPDNCRHLRELGQQAGKVVAAWGANWAATDLAVAHARSAVRVPLYCFGTTKQGAPRHPLYVRGDQPLVEWRADA